MNPILIYSKLRRKHFSIMDELNGGSLKKLQFFVTESYPCSYLPERIARSQVAINSSTIDSDSYSRLVKEGFRRSGPFTYRPDCVGCESCISVRIKASEFTAHRSQRRAWHHHESLLIEEQKLQYYDGHFELFARYQGARHGYTVGPAKVLEQYRQFLLSSQVDTRLIEFRCSEDGRLVMVSIIDLLTDGLSAVYTFFDPEPGNSYGIFNVLWQIQLAQKMNLPYVYLGYWIKECQKMNYKLTFHPLEFFKYDRWVASDKKLSMP